MPECGERDCSVHLHLTESYARSTLPPLGETVNSYGANSVFDTIKVRGFEVPIYLDGLRLPVEPGNDIRAVAARTWSANSTPTI